MSVPAPYREYPPHPRLRGVVACYWTHRSSGHFRVLPDACIDRGIGDRLHLMHHLDRVGIHHEQPVDPGERRRKRPRVVQVDENRRLALGLPRGDLGFAPRRSNNFDARIGVEKRRQGTARTASCAEH